MPLTEHSFHLLTPRPPFTAPILTSSSPSPHRADIKSEKIMNQSFRGDSLQKLLSKSNIFVEELLTVGYESMPPSKRYKGVKVRK